jgi:hypothetical protein
VHKWKFLQQVSESVLFPAGTGATIKCDKCREDAAIRYANNLPFEGDAMTCVPPGQSVKFAMLPRMYGKECLDRIKNAVIGRER